MEFSLHTAFNNEAYSSLLAFMFWRPKLLKERVLAYF